MVATKKKKQQVNYKEDSSEEEDEESDSEDDVPLAALKSKKPAAKTAAVKKKATPPAKKKTAAKKKTPAKKKKAPVKKKKKKTDDRDGVEEKVRIRGPKTGPSGRGRFFEEVLRLFARATTGFDHGGGVVDGTRFVGRRESARKGAQGVYETEDGAEHEEFDRGGRTTETVFGRD